MPIVLKEDEFLELHRKGKLALKKLDAVKIPKVPGKKPDQMQIKLDEIRDALKSVNDEFSTYKDLTPSKGDMLDVLKAISDNNKKPDSWRIGIDYKLKVMRDKNGFIETITAERVE